MRRKPSAHLFRDGEYALKVSRKWSMSMVVWFEGKQFGTPCYNESGVDCLILRRHACLFWIIW